MELLRSQREEPTKGEVRSLFNYVDGDLVWRVNRGSNRTKGRVAGTKDGKGYTQISILKKFFRAHRLVWIYHHGPIPRGKEIDHLDHDRLNNRIDNLRVVCSHTNRKNQKRSTSNTSGRTGVYYNKRVMRWCAQMKHYGETWHLGSFDNFEDACAARREEERRLGFHANHGAA